MCGVSLQDENIMTYMTRSHEAFAVFECPKKHYRCHVSKYRKILIIDFADADGYCVRRHFERKMSDIVMSGKVVIYDYETSIDYVKKYDRILSDEEVRDTVKRCIKLTILK